MPTTHQHESLDTIAAFKIADPREVTRALRELHEQSVHVHVRLQDDAQLISKPLAVDISRDIMVLELAADQEGLDFLQQQDHVACVAYPGAFKLLFDLCDLTLACEDHRCSLVGRLPSDVFRIQRRDSFRVRMIERDGSVARFRDPKNPQALLSLRVLDVSVTGCAFLLPDTAPRFAAGDRIADVSVELNAKTQFQATVVVRHVGPHQSHMKGMKLGCELQNLSSVSERALQRCIDQTQKQLRWASALI